MRDDGDFKTRSLVEEQSVFICDMTWDSRASPISVCSVGLVTEEILEVETVGDNRGRDCPSDWGCCVREREI